MPEPIKITVDAQMAAKNWQQLIAGQLKSAAAIFGHNSPLSLTVCDCDHEGSGKTDITIGPVGTPPAAPQPEKPSGEG